MVASIFIIIFSVALFVYWFRYTCLLILSARTAQDYARRVAEANQLGFLELQPVLAGSADVSLDGIHSALSRDYRVITYLLSHAGNFQDEGSGMERLMLRIDFRVMSVLYRVVPETSPVYARRVLSEMAEIISHFANSMGERQAIGSAA
ncbi:MAG: hypothetical protein IT160_20015 [Bryobacterales bacterium]|nr:hypothetical protein [Bryobacterales bacterium]